MRFNATVVLIAVAACSTNASQDPVGGASDESAFTGEWEVEFTLDSVRSSGDTRAWARKDAPPARGSLRILGAAEDTSEHRASMSVDFRPLLGRQMSCYEPGPLDIRITRADSTTSLWFTPRAADCGFSSSARRSGDTLRGEWSETSFIGPVAQGRFSMVRR